MEKLALSALMTDSETDPRSSGWLVDNVWHPFINGTGAKQIYNNFAGEKLEPEYVPAAKTGTEWMTQTLSSAGGAVLSYAIAARATGIGLVSAGAKLGLEGTAARIVGSDATAQILGAGLFDFAKAPNQGETRLGNMAGSLAAFSVFAGGNHLLSSSKNLAESSLYAGLGRIGVGALGGLTSLETSHAVSSKTGGDLSPLTWEDRKHAMASGGFINFALPPVSKALSQALGEARKPASAESESRGVASSEPSEKSGSSVARTVGDKQQSSSAGAEKSTELILLKQQLEPQAREQQMLMVAGKLADFVGDANKSVHIAIYDLSLKNPAVEKLVVDALNNRAEKGVDVHLAYFKPEGKPELQPGKAFTAPSEATAYEFPVRGPSAEFLAKLSPNIKTEALSSADIAALEKPAKSGSASDTVSVGAQLNRLVDSQKGVEGELGSDIGSTGITGGGKLMHNKYVVRDPGTDNAAVWTGSTNFTDGAFGDQDNNIVQVKSRALADVYEKNFQQLVAKGDIRGTGKDLHTSVNIGGGSVSVAFSPGDGAWIDSQYAKLISEADSQIHIASMVISSPEILKALADAKKSGVALDGIYDGPQMKNVVRAWSKSSSTGSQEKLALWDQVKDSLIAKNSHPYSPEGPHDFMHNKTVAVDGKKAATGSFNLSINATQNAENVLIFDDPAVASQYSSYIEDLIKTYSKKVSSSSTSNPGTDK